MAKKSKKMNNNIDIKFDDKQKKKKKNKNVGVDVKLDPKKKSKTKQNDKFDFDNEIVIGVNIVPPKKKDKPSKKSKNKDISKQKRSKKKNTTTINSKHIDVNINNSTKNKKSQKNTNENVIPLEKQKSGKKVALAIIKIILIIALFVGIIIFMMTTSLFNVTKIEISGNYRVTKQRIESLSQINLDVNTYRYSKAQIEDSIKEEPYIENVVVKRKLPNTIKIEVSERTPNYIIMYSSSYVYINNYGYILEISNESLSLPIIEGYTTSQEKIVPGNRLNSDDLEKLNTVLKLTESMQNNEILDKVTSIDISDKNNYIIKMENERKTVYLGDASNINDRVLMLKEILIKEADFEGEIFMKDLSKIYFHPNS